MGIGPYAVASRTGRGYQLAQAALDTDRRAWLVCSGRLERMPAGGPPELGPGLLRELLNAASLTGFFPTGPIDWLPDQAEVEPFEDGYRVISRTSWRGEPYLECQMGIAGDGMVGMCLTRSGRFVDHLIGPGSVLLTDVETLIVDTMVLLDVTAHRLDLRGGSHVLTDVLFTAPGEPLLLCTLDTVSGGRPSPGRVVEDFEPVVLDYRGDGGAGAGHAVVWEAFRKAAAQFGAAGPQYLPDPQTGTPWSSTGRAGHTAPVLRRPSGSSRRR